jgi:hypothetical protein
MPCPAQLLGKASSIILTYRTKDVARWLKSC